MSHRKILFIIAPFILLILLRVLPFLLPSGKDGAKTSVSAENVLGPAVGQRPSGPGSNQDLKALGIISTAKESQPRSQMEWDFYMKQSMDQLQTLEKNADVKRKPANDLKRLEARVQLINSRIREYEKTVQNNPDDADAAQKLQNLYMLKATLSAMEAQTERVQ